MRFNISNNKFFKFVCYYSFFNTFLILLNYNLRLFSIDHLIDFMDNHKTFFYYIYSVNMIFNVLIIVELEQCFFSDHVKSVFSKISKTGFICFICNMPFMTQNFNYEKDYFIYFYLFSSSLCLLNTFYCYYAIKNINLDSFRYSKKDFDSFFKKHFYASRHAYGYLLLFLICIFVLPSIAIVDIENNTDYDRYGFLKEFIVEKHLVKDNKSIYLAGMTHRAIASFYDEVLQNHEPDSKTIILKEGIRKGKKIKSSKYLAKRDKKWKREYPYLKLQTEYWKDFSRFNHISGDITYDHYNELMQKFHKDEKLTKSQKKDFKNVYHSEVIIKRNDYLLNILFEKINDYNVFILPWGAGHMRDLEKKLIKKGFEIKGERLRKNRDFILEFINIVLSKIKNLKQKHLKE